MDGELGTKLVGTSAEDCLRQPRRGGTVRRDADAIK
jgi:hypothetical protein